MELTVISTPTKTVWIVLKNGYEECWEDVTGEILNIGGQLTFETMERSLVTIQCTEVAVLEIRDNQDAENSSPRRPIDLVNRA